MTVDGIGYLEVNPAVDTTYTLTLDGGITASATVRVFADQATWLGEHFTVAELANPAISADDADPDDDGFSNLDEYRFQTDPRDAASLPELNAVVIAEGGAFYADFSSPYPLDSGLCTMVVEQSHDLADWSPLPPSRYRELDRSPAQGQGTPVIKVRVDSLVSPQSDDRDFYRGSWQTGR